VLFLAVAGLRMDRGNWIAIGATTVVALANWAWVRALRPRVAERESV